MCFKSINDQANKLLELKEESPETWRKTEIVKEKKKAMDDKENTQKVKNNLKYLQNYKKLFCQRKTNLVCLFALETFSATKKKQALLTKDIINP